MNVIYNDFLLGKLNLGFILKLALQLTPIHYTTYP